ncbi:hypothetical protein [Streptomyces sp. NPDC002599]|uniref:hypothetical protein n=1 Tax=Streptomyces sp. NPDC002599 TaxID=3154421 RepID=UPI003326B331
MPRIERSPAERKAAARRAIATRYGHTEDAHRWGVALLEAKADTLAAEVEALRAQAAEMKRTGPAA